MSWVFYDGEHLSMSRGDCGGFPPRVTAVNLGVMTVGVCVSGDMPLCVSRSCYDHGYVSRYHDDSVHIWASLVAQW